MKRRFKEYKTRLLESTIPIRNLKSGILADFECIFGKLGSITSSGEGAEEALLSIVRRYINDTGVKRSGRIGYDKGQGWQCHTTMAEEKMHNANWERWSRGYYVLAGDTLYFFFKEDEQVDAEGKTKLGVIYELSNMLNLKPGALTQKLRFERVSEIKNAISKAKKMYTTNKEIGDALAAMRIKPLEVQIAMKS